MGPEADPITIRQYVEIAIAGFVCLSPVVTGFLYLLANAKVKSLERQDLQYHQETGQPEVNKNSAAPTKGVNLKGFFWWREQKAAYRGTTTMKGEPMKLPDLTYQEENERMQELLKSAWYDDPAYKEHNSN